MKSFHDYETRIVYKKYPAKSDTIDQHQNAKKHPNGCILLDSWEFAAPDSISTNTLAKMDAVITNFRSGHTSSGIDLSDF